MKKLLLFSAFLLATAYASAQLVVTVLPPSEFAGNVEFATVSDDGSWTSYPDMENPENAVIGFLAVARDTSANADSTACAIIANPEEIAGKIAVVYRGDCNFEAKAKNVQDAGAIGVIVANRLDEAIIGGMSCDLQCDEVSIPFVFVQGEPVASWRPSIDAGEIEVLIGNKNGLFADDIGTKPGLVLRAEYFAQNRVLAQNGDEYSVKVGGGIINYGQNVQTGVTLNATITKDGVELYNETNETPIIMAPNDTNFFELPDFAPESFSSGMYEVTYNLISNAEDLFPGDNELSANFVISDSLFSYARLNDEGLPRGSYYSRPSSATEGIHSCIAFQDPNASKVFVEGLTFSMSTNLDDMTGETVFAYVYEWESEFEDLNDPNLVLDSDVLTERAFGEYEYLENLESVNIYIPFEEGAYTLEDNVRYLFCINYYGEESFAGHDGPSMDYNQNLEAYLQPLFPVQSESDATPWNVNGFGTDIVPAISVNMKDPLYDNVSDHAQQIRLDAYPNPSSDVVNINIPDNLGTVLVDVYDVTGKQVDAIQTSVGNGGVLRVDVSNLENGAYIFNLKFENGSYSNINVVVAGQ